jgi:predicted Zn-dependent protease
VQQGGGLMVDPSPGTDASVPSPQTLAVADTPKNKLSKYLNVVGRNLAARSARPTLQWTFGVLDSQVVNAVSAPGGYVFVTRGLLQRVDNEAALAGVLSHEIAHVTRKDAFLIYQKTKVDQCKTLAYAKAGQKEGMGALRNYGPGFIKTAIYALDSFSGGPLELNAAADSALLTLFSDEFVHRYLESGYARDQELGADSIGLELTVATGYNPRGFIDFEA